MFRLPVRSPFQFSPVPFREFHDSKFPQTGICFFLCTDDQMIQHIDPEDLSGADHPLRQVDVLFGWFQDPAWMIVDLCQVFFYAKFLP